MQRLTQQNKRPLLKDLASRVSQLSSSLSKLFNIIILTRRYGNKYEYNGGRTENEIVSWILKKVGPPTQEVTCDELKDKVDNKKLVLAYFGEKDDKKFNIF